MSGLVKKRNEAMSHPMEGMMDLRHAASQLGRIKTARQGLLLSWRTGNFPFELRMPGLYDDSVNIIVRGKAGANGASATSFGSVRTATGSSTITKSIKTTPVIPRWQSPHWRGFWMIRIW